MKIENDVLVCEPQETSEYAFTTWRHSFAKLLSVLGQTLYTKEMEDEYLSIGLSVSVGCVLTKRDIQPIVTDVKITALTVADTDEEIYCRNWHIDMTTLEKLTKVFCYTLHRVGTEFRVTENPEKSIYVSLEQIIYVLNDDYQNDVVGYMYHESWLSLLDQIAKKGIDMRQGMTLAEFKAAGEDLEGAAGLVDYVFGWYL